jgi:membrane protease YdiL (CAAX protease family)
VELPADSPLLGPAEPDAVDDESDDGEEAPRGYFGTSRSLFNALVLAAPLFVAYQVGVLFTEGWKNGVDFVTPKLWALVGESKPAYLAVNVALLAVLLAGGRLVRRPYRLRPTTWLLVLVESALYASVLGGAIVGLMEVLGVSPALAMSLSAADHLVLSFSAGAYEELVFRLLLLTGLVAVARWMGLATFGALVLAFAVSSVLFSAAHHPPLGVEPWTAGAFTYRLIAGLLFAGLFVVRGFAVAAYTHAFYDVTVLVMG